MNSELPKRIVVYRYSEDNDIVIAVFPEIPANNVAANMETYSFRFGLVGIDENMLREDTEPAREHPDTPELNKHIRLLHDELSRKYSLVRRDRLLRRFKLIRHTKLYADDSKRSESVTEPTNTI